MYFVGASSNASCSGKLQAVAAISKRSTCHVVVVHQIQIKLMIDWQPFSVNFLTFTLLITLSQ